MGFKYHLCLADVNLEEKPLLSAGVSLTGSFDFAFLTVPGARYRA